MASGVALLKLHGNPSAADLFIYSLPETSVNRDRLTAQLRALNNVAEKLVLKRQQNEPRGNRTPAEVRAIEAAETRARNTEPPGDLPVESLPEELRPLRRELTDIHATILYLKGRTSSLQDGMDLRRHAEEIVRLYKQSRKGWYVIETFRATGHILRPDAPEKVEGRVARLQRIRNLRVYLSPRRMAERNTTETEAAALRKELKQLEEAEAHEAVAA